MLKTNAAKARANIRAYLRDTIDSPEELAEQYNSQTLFDAHAPGLGDFIVNYACAVDIYYDEQRARIAEWLEETPEEAAKYSDDKVHSLYKVLIEREFLPTFGYYMGFDRNPAGRAVAVLCKA